MFTGIVQSSVEIVSCLRKAGLLSIELRLPEAYSEGLQLGASIAIDGVCLTVTAFSTEADKTSKVSFDIMQQTLDLTTLNQLQVGSKVNIERSATMSAEIGGHIVSGHIDNTAKIVEISEDDNLRKFYYQYPAKLDKYLFDKGFVALNGCSLTIAEIDYDKHQLCVSYIPETLRVTTHGQKLIGDIVNLEIDRQTQAIVDTVERVIAQRGSLS